jgi:hypothetical protein
MTLAVGAFDVVTTGSLESHDVNCQMKIHKITYVAQGFHNHSNSNRLGFVQDSRTTDHASLRPMP